MRQKGAAAVPAITVGERAEATGRNAHVQEGGTLRGGTLNAGPRAYTPLEKRRMSRFSARSWSKLSCAAAAGSVSDFNNLKRTRLPRRSCLLRLLDDLTLLDAVRTRLALLRLQPDW